MRFPPRRGSSNSLYILVFGSMILVGVLVAMMMVEPSRKTTATTQDADAKSLMLHCAAGMKYAVDEIVEQYEQESGIDITVNYGGSNTLLSQMSVEASGDLYLAADDYYITTGREKGLLAEALPIASQKPVIAVRRGNPKNVQSIADLKRSDVAVVLPNPEAAACGRKVQKLLNASGDWAEVKAATRVFKPTVNETINAVKLESDACIVWNSTVSQYPDLEAIECEELDRGIANISVAVLQQSKQPTAALRFARFITSRDRGLKTFRAKGIQTVAGDVWSKRPELTLFAGAVNRNAIEPIVEEFAQREGAVVNTKYNGCGILTAEMKELDSDHAGGFPDTFLACDIYYLESVQEMFEDGVSVSDTDIVMVVKKGNPKQILALEDLLRDDVRLVLGEPKQCTIGVLSRRLLQDTGIYEKLMNEKSVPMKPSSAMLVPDVIADAADVVLAYATDTRAESSKIDAVPIDSPLAQAIQPFSIAKSSDHKYLSRRLFEKITQSRDKFEAAGFNWRLDD